MLNKLIHTGATLRYLRFSLGWCGEFGFHSVSLIIGILQSLISSAFAFCTSKGITPFLPQIRTYRLAAFITNTKGVWAFYLGGLKFSIPPKLSEVFACLFHAQLTALVINHYGVFFIFHVVIHAR